MVDIEIKCDVTGLGTCCGCFCRMLKKKKKRLLAWPLTGRYFQSADLTGFCVSQTPEINHRALDVHPHLVIIKALSDGTKDSATVLFPLEDLWGVWPYPALRLRWIIIFYFILFFGFYVFSDTVGNHNKIIIKKKNEFEFSVLNCSVCCFWAFCTRPGHWPNMEMGGVIVKSPTGFEKQPFWTLVVGLGCRL